eukprot:g2511.t1
MCLAPIADMSTDSLAAYDIRQSPDAPAWWFWFSLAVMGLTLRGAAVLKYYLAVMMLERGEDALPEWLDDQLYEQLPQWLYDQLSIKGKGGLFSFAYIPLAFLPGMPYCCLQHSVFRGYQAASEEDKKGYTDYDDKAPPHEPDRSALRTLLVGLCTEVFVLPASLLFGPLVICWESFAAMPETFWGKVANPAAQGFDDKLRIVVLFLFQFLDGAMEAVPQTGLQVHAYLRGGLHAAVFFPSLAISVFNIVKTAFAFYENMELIRFVAEVDSKTLSESTFKSYFDSCLKSEFITSLDLSGCKLGPAGAKFVANAMKDFGDKHVLTSLNLAGNNFGAEGAKDVAEALKVNVSALRFDWYHLDLDLTPGSTAVVCGYSYYNTTKGALVKFNISSNALSAEGTKAVAKALKGNNSMTELNISSNNMTCDSQGYVGKDMSGVTDIANAIPTMGALASLDIRFNDIPSDQQSTIKSICANKSIALSL